ncbi:acyl-CoA dehydrogenase [Paenibacillus sp. CFBP13512]|uniref:acyl-CoA dehydrogenase family protein n=1 Tax=Paenibacillus sp. CFBP13512 TaxID=2184007 RepID=UPI0010BFDB5A|nr:acyl-CoA dehydrogenase family protein [Paenibacillus sp. CFBP13512]TKJ93355.1 acyl-CoA dehydrogenase [Paenibacillus sp. CFBP13512]
MDYSYEQSTIPNIIAEVKKITREFAKRANVQDQNGTFPVENLADLKSSGLMSISLPNYYTDQNQPNLKVLSSIAEIMASGCLSTAMIWAMHIQQVEVLLQQEKNEFVFKLLSRLKEEQPLIASVTTEKEKGGHLLSSHSPLLSDGDDIFIDRNAPIVTGGEYADWFLITMKESIESSTNEVKLIFAERNQLKLNYVSEWKAMGMRSTGSVGMEIEGTIKKEQIMGASEQFKHLAVKAMIPIGHILWSSCWLGAAKGVFEGLIQVIRDPQNRARYNLKSDSLYEKIARIRLQLDTVSIYLNEMIKRYEISSDNQETIKLLEEPRFNIHINNLKVLASENLFNATNSMMEVAGLTYGFVNNDMVPLERVFRDIRSASLMYHNDRLLLVNGKMSLIDNHLLP